MTVPIWARRATLAGLTAFALLAAGCGSGHVPLTGDVSYDGTPIDDGTITFVPTSGGSSDANKASCHIENGKYKFEKDRGPAPGKYKVEITWMQKGGKRMASGDPDVPGRPAPAPPPAAVAKKGPADPDIVRLDDRTQVLPAKFNTQTTLTADVSSGNTKLDFPLKSTQ